MILVPPPHERGFNFVTECIRSLADSESAQNRHSGRVLTGAVGCDYFLVISLGLALTLACS